MSENAVFVTSEPALPTDVTDAAQVTALVETSTDLIGPLNLLVNNAGGSRSVGPLFSMEADEWWADIVCTLSPGTVHTPIVDELIGTPRAQEWMPYLTPETSISSYISPDLAAGHVVRIAAGDIDPLVGRFLHAQDDLGALLARVDDITNDGELLLRLT